MLLAIIILGLALRLWLLVTTSDFPGDGPNRAVQAFLWSQHPSWITSAVWPPGHIYLNGLAMMIYPDPAITARALNIMLAVPTIAAMYFLSRRLFGKPVALVSAALLACLPLHAGLSASSLTEAPSLALFLVATALLMHLRPPAAQCFRTNRNILLGATVCLVLLEALRVESWMYAAALIIYVWWKLRDIRLTAMFAGALATFPTYWLASCWMELNQPLYSFATWADPRNEPSSLFAAVGLVINRTFTQLGLIVPVLAVAGLVGAIFSPTQPAMSEEATSKTQAELALTFSLLGLTTILSISVATMHGANLHDRYLLNYMVFLLPFAALAICRLRWIADRLKSVLPVKRNIGTLIATMIGAVVVLLPTVIHTPEIYVRSGKPTELIEAANWLSSSEFAGKPILMTGIDYRAFYIPMFAKTSARDLQIVLDFWTPLLDTQDWLRTHEPRLLVVGQSDGKDLAAITSICSFKLNSKPVFSNRVVSAYKIMPGTFALKQDCVLPACLAYPKPSWRTFFQPWKRRSLDSGG